MKEVFSNSLAIGTLCPLLLIPATFVALAFLNIHRRNKFLGDS